ncbi:MAG TPA: hypothetical protein VIT23_09210, partial [Terrimicrobiaceae bacterium]
DIADAAKASGNMVTASGARYTAEGNEWRFEMYFRASQQDSLPPRLIEQLAARPDVKEVRWSPTIRT